MSKSTINQVTKDSKQAPEKHQPTIQDSQKAARNRRKNALFLMQKKATNTPATLTNTE